MNLYDLYLDFDGVIADTINVTYEMMRRLKIDIDNDVNSVSKFYKELNWMELLNNVNEIKEAFNNIKRMKELSIYNLSILTTVNSLEELIAKIEYIRKRDKDIKIIGVPKGIDKKELVRAKGAILVDDYSGNLHPWMDAGGISIKFSEKENNNYITINSLEILTEEKFLRKLNRVS